MAAKFLSSFKVELLKSWWVLFFTLLCFVFYEREVKEWNIQHLALSKQLLELQKDKQQALAQQIELRNQVQSQESPEWIELLLMRELGVVPEGSKKIYFNP